MNSEPFLWRYREEAMLDDLEGHYDPEQEVWVVDTPAGVVPLILLGSERSGTATITRVRTETSDED